MRIIGHIEHPVLKITIFKMDEKYAVKFESGLFEQTYKLRTGSEISSLEDIQKLVDPKWQHDVMEILKQMNQTKLAATARYMSADFESEFEEIL